MVLLATSWMDNKACSDSDVDFFPNELDKQAVESAKEICHSCPVRIDCLWWAINTETHYGIFGAATDSEREFLKYLLPVIQVRVAS